MAPIISSSQAVIRRMAEVTKPTDPNTLIIESWAQGFMVGSILIMLCTTVSNYRRGVLLHKLILLEVKKYTRSCFVVSQGDKLIFFSLSLVPSMARSSSTMLQSIAGTFL